MFRYGFFNTVPMTSSERSKYSVQRKLKNEASRTHISDVRFCSRETATDQNFPKRPLVPCNLYRFQAPKKRAQSYLHTSLATIEKLARSKGL